MQAIHRLKSSLSRCGKLRETKLFFFLNSMKEELLGNGTKFKCWYSNSSLHLERKWQTYVDHAEKVTYENGFFSCSSHFLVLWQNEFRGSEMKFICILVSKGLLSFLGTTKCINFSFYCRMNYFKKYSPTISWNRLKRIEKLEKKGKRRDILIKCT